MLFQLQPALDRLSTEPFTWTVLLVLLPFACYCPVTLLRSLVAEDGVGEGPEGMRMVCLPTVRILQDSIDRRL